MRNIRSYRRLNLAINWPIYLFKILFSIFLSLNVFGSINSDTHTLYETYNDIGTIDWGNTVQEPETTNTSENINENTNKNTNDSSLRNIVIQAKIAPNVNDYYKVKEEISKLKNLTSKKYVMYSELLVKYEKCRLELLSITTKYNHTLDENKKHKIEIEKLKNLVRYID
ncbi:MAG: hypothetical protein CMG74_06830 [Candidatus Marinimicrobia bacterium]|nr:hypothetical protein [Candidatus Neomarinimicrobiota bacterium]|tara:strand:- start:3429 stop:3935 length:507 start_codon:yes stop_codon:yes gene_type:complete